MCGMFANVRVDESIELPHFPEDLDHSFPAMQWQCKRGLNRYGGTYRITEDGRLEQKKESHRDKTEEEKLEEAQKWGFDSWEEFTAAYDDHGCGDGLYPDSVDFEMEETDGEDEHPPMTPREQTLNEEWWADISHHGTFEFHALLREEPQDTETIDPNLCIVDGESNNDDQTFERPTDYLLDVLVEYEARFTRGKLDDIVFVGERHNDQPFESAVEKLEEYKQNK